MRRWYFTRQEIEDDSPSRRDGMSLKKESQLRGLYCSFIHEMGKRLGLSQTIIACGMMLCHRFYMLQSHAKNDWQTIATSSFYLAGKIAEGIPRSFLGEVVVNSYEIQHELDYSASQRIRQTEVFNERKELILFGERVVLSTVGFDLDIQLPYSSLGAALKSLNLGREFGQVALNFVNDCLRTSLCLRYKPEYIAAASVALAAEIERVRLPTHQGRVWWLEFDISPEQLNEAIRRMIRLYRKQAPRTIESETSSRKPRGTTDENAGSEREPTTVELDDPKSRCNILPVDSNCNKIDIDRIRELKRRRCEKAASKKLVSVNDELDTEAWIENELENGLELGDTSSK